MSIYESVQLTIDTLTQEAIELERDGDRRPMLRGMVLGAELVLSNLRNFATLDVVEKQMI